MREYSDHSLEALLTDGRERRLYEYADDETGDAQEYEGRGEVEDEYQEAEQGLDVIVYVQEKPILLARAEKNQFGQEPAKKVQR